MTLPRALRSAFITLAGGSPTRVGLPLSRAIGHGDLRGAQCDPPMDFGASVGDLSAAPLLIPGRLAADPAAAEFRRGLLSILLRWSGRFGCGRSSWRIRASSRAQ